MLRRERGYVTCVVVSFQNLAQTLLTGDHPKKIEIKHHCRLSWRLAVKETTETLLLENDQHATTA